MKVNQKMVFEQIEILLETEDEVHMFLEVIHKLHYQKPEEEFRITLSKSEIDLMRKLSKGLRGELN